MFWVNGIRVFELICFFIFDCMINLMVFLYIFVFCIGLGIYWFIGVDGIKIMEVVIDYGYWYIDMVCFYENEFEVGKVVLVCGLSCEEFFVIMKVWFIDFFKLVVKMEDFLKKLKLEYVDLFLLYWFVFDEENKCVLELFNEVLYKGYVKYVGVFNFMFE